MLPTTLEVKNSMGDIAYSGPIVPLVQVNGQMYANRSLLFLNFDVSKVSQEGLDDVASDLSFDGVELDEAMVTDDEAYISVLTTINAGPYEIAFEGNDKFAPFDVRVEFIE